MFQMGLSPVRAHRTVNRNTCAQAWGGSAALAAGAGTSKRDQLQRKSMGKRRRTSGEPYAMMLEEPDGILYFMGALANASADATDSGGETEALR